MEPNSLMKSVFPMFTVVIARIARISGSVDGDLLAKDNDDFAICEHC